MCYGQLGSMCFETIGDVDQFHGVYGTENLKIAVRLSLVHIDAKLYLFVNVYPETESTAHHVGYCHRAEHPSSIIVARNCGIINFQSLVNKFKD